MKKIIVALFLLIVLVIAAIYIFIPNTLIVNNIASLRCSLPGAGRVLIQKENWKKFWPGTSRLTPQKSFISDDLFFYQTDTLQVVELLQNTLRINISGSDRKVNSTLLLLPLTKDSIAISWSYQTPASRNPLLRIKQYRQAVYTKKNMTAILNAIKKFLNKDENVYGFAVSQTSTTDTFLISTKSTLNAYPSIIQIYLSIDKLKAYIKEKAAVQTGFPMLNITQPDTHHYTMMTAIPVNKLLTEKGDITYKRMVPGRFLTTTVTGGNATINNTYNQMLLYFQDYSRTSMAIPFMYLVTDRSKETDTSKWVTKLYFPVM